MSDILPSYLRLLDHDPRYVQRAERVRATIRRGGQVLGSVTDLAYTITSYPNQDFQGSWGAAFHLPVTAGVRYRERLQVELDDGRFGEATVVGVEPTRWRQEINVISAERFACMTNS